MHQSKLVRYIRELPAKKRERFRQFVSSPYFNQHQKTIEMLEYIIKQIERSNPKLDRQEVFKQLFPREKYQEQKLHNVMSYLKKQYHRFLAIQYFEEQDFSEAIYTLEAAFDSNQFDLLKNRAKQLEKTMRSHKNQGSAYLFANYRLNFLMAYYTGEFEDRYRSDNFQKMIDNLDQYYLVEKLQITCRLTANMILINTNYNFHFLEELLAYMHKHWDYYKQNPSIELYYTILMSLREEQNPVHYEKMKELLASKVDRFSASEVGDLYTFSYNYCIRRINTGDSAYQRELFNLYNQGLNNGLLLTNGLISEFDYKNITTLGCALKEFDWTEQFIQEYKERLPANKRENAYNYNLANLYYNKKMYNEASSTLLHVQFTDVKYHLSTTFLLLRTYYALKDTEALLSLIETFRIYVMRNRKMTTGLKRGYTNFLRFAKKLVLLKHHSSTYSKKVLDEKLDKLVEKINNTENVINRQWLLNECRAEAIA